MGSQASSGRKEAELAALVLAAKGGAPEAIDQLLRRYRPLLLHLAATEMPADMQAKMGGSDLVQDSLLLASQNIGDFAGGTEKELIAWLRRILLNQMLNHVQHWQAAKRDIGREEALGDAPAVHAADRTPSSVLHAAEERLLVDLAVLELPEHYRQVIDLRYKQDLAFAEIGQRLECSEEAARKLWGRALAALQKRIKCHE
jgi:RNA polymerase sigma-70 factor (subfamily 1)